MLFIGFQNYWSLRDEMEHSISWTNLDKSNIGEYTCKETKSHQLKQLKVKLKLIIKLNLLVSK